MALPTAAFGITGLTLPRLGLGLAALGRPGYINLGHSEDLASDYVKEAMEGRTHRLLDLAVKNGIRYFDAARSYGCAEDFLFSWLEQNGVELNDSLVIGSKWGYTYTADWKVEAAIHEVKDHSAANLKKQWEESSCLRPYLKLYQIHSATLDTGVLDDAQVLDTLGRLKADGLLIGLSISGADQPAVLDKALGIELDGRRLFDSAQLTYNVLEQSAAPALEAAAAEGLGIIVKEALANGRLTERNNSDNFADRKAALGELAEKYHCGMDTIALAFVLRQPWAHVVLSGAVTERHLESNLKAARIPVQDDELAALEPLQMETEVYWQERAELAWN